jgi:hypothetical protein
MGDHGCSLARQFTRNALTNATGFNACNEGEFTRK